MRLSQLQFLSPKKAMEKIWNGSLCETRGQLILDYFNTEYEPLFEEVPNHYAQPWFMVHEATQIKKKSVIK